MGCLFTFISITDVRGFILPSMPKGIAHDRNWHRAIFAIDSHQ